MLAANFCKSLFSSEGSEETEKLLQHIDGVDELAVDSSRDR